MTRREKIESAVAGTSWWAWNSTETLVDIIDELRALWAIVDASHGRNGLRDLDAMAAALYDYEAETAAKP